MKKSKNIYNQLYILIKGRLEGPQKSYMPKLENFKKYILEIKWILASLIITFLGITILYIHTQIPEREVLEVFLREFGVAFIIAGVVSFVYEYFLRVGLVELIMEKHDIAKSITDAGIQGVYNPTAGSRIDIERNIPYFLDTATNKIKLLGITTDLYFRQGPGSHSYDKIIDLLKNGCNIQILLLNPDTSQEEKTKGMDVPYCVLARAKAENENPKALQRKIRDSFNTKFKLQKKYGDLLEIKFYDSPPLCAMTILDRKMKVTPYLNGKLGLQSPTFELKKDEHGPIGLFGVYEKHFNSLWKTGLERTEPYDI